MLLTIVWQTCGNIFLWQAIEQFYFFNILYPFFNDNKYYDKNLYALIFFYISAFIRERLILFRSGKNICNFLAVLLHLKIL